MAYGMGLESESKLDPVTCYTPSAIRSVSREDTFQGNQTTIAGDRAPVRYSDYAAICSTMPRRAWANSPPVR
jgi:hypothetical protein